MTGASTRGRPRAVFRCDASPGIGGGHVARCLALAGRLNQDGWWCGFAVRGETLRTVPALAAQADGVLLLDGPAAAEPAAIGRWTGGAVDLLVVDHYQRDAAFETASRPWTRRILVVDDLADRLHDPDLLLDPGCGRHADDYRALVPPACRVLAGADFALLRPEFAELRSLALVRRRETQQARRLLVAFGATDPADASTLALKAIAASGIPVEVTVLLGTAAPHLARVQEQARMMPHPAVVQVGCDTVAAQMAAADLAIGAGGGMAWERCCLGLPALVVGIAGNQHASSCWLSQRGAAVSVGPVEEVTVGRLAMTIRAVALDGARLRALSAAAAALCDGGGTGRVRDALAALGLGGKSASVTLRQAEMADAKAMFRWQTHPSTRQHSFCSRAPAWDEHIRWLQAKLADPGCVFRIIAVAGAPAGTLRLDPCRLDGLQDAREVSIVVAPEFRGRGIGRRALQAAAALPPGVPLVARIRPGNSASQRMFLRAGYQPLAPGVFVYARHDGGKPAAPAPEVME